MKRASRRITMVTVMSVVLGAALGSGLVPRPAGAQQADPFAAVAKVDETAVTRFEVLQRLRLLQVLRMPGLSEERALNDLIDDLLKLTAASRAGIVPTSDEVSLGIEDFAAQANLGSEEFLQAVGEVGIEPETVRDYLRVTLAWGDLVRSRFAPRARPSDAEIDRALALGTGRGSARVLISEIVLPMSPQMAPLSEERARAIAQMTSFADFETAARQFSVAPTRASGGRLDWLSLSELPPQIAPLFLTLQPGEITPPVQVDGAIALFQLRALQDIAPPRASNETVDYARVRLAPGSDPGRELTALRARVDRCDDLFGVLFPASEDVLIRDTVAAGALPAGVGRALRDLDPGEMAAVPPTGSADGGSVVMLCNRIAVQQEDLTREEVQQQLFARRLNSYADAYLEELRAGAFIVRP